MNQYLVSQCHSVRNLVSSDAVKVQKVLLLYFPIQVEAGFDFGSIDFIYPDGNIVPYRNTEPTGQIDNDYE